MLLKPFLQQCLNQPSAVALVENDRELSYGALLARAQSVAAGLQALGVQPGQPVAVYMDRGIDAVIALFGALLAGACYVPLDLKNPAPRLAFIIDDARVQAVLGLGLAPATLNPRLWLDITICSDHTPEPVDTSAKSLAAILYTSGSTGLPRGVALSHRAIASFALWATDLLALTPADRIASSAPFFFDLSTFDLYAVLGSGGSLHFVPSKLNLAPARLSIWLQEQVISGWYTVPSLLAFLAYKGNLTQTPLPSLRFLIFAGEVFPSPALINLSSSLPGTALYNFFGPTETNVCCYWPVKRERLTAEENIPIGQPAAGCELHVHSETGELWVRGPTLASGYWHQGLMQCFLNEDDWYPTGDRVSLMDGEYRFHGRLGRMLKCSGYRIEPAEIEAAVNLLDGVRACAVVGIDDPVVGQRPALALVLASRASSAEIRKALLRLLPSYMQPSRCIVLEDLPYLPNGKLDYKQVRTLLEAQP